MAIDQELENIQAEKKLDYKCTAPCMVTTSINKNPYKLDLPSTMQHHIVFHVSHLDHCTLSVCGQPSSEPHPLIVHQTERWEADPILGSGRQYQKLHFLIQWADYSHICTSWEPAEHLEHARALVDEFHQECPDWPRE